MATISNHFIVKFENYMSNSEALCRTKELRKDFEVKITHQCMETVFQSVIYPSL
jgi:hypothetical protein